MQCRSLVLALCAALALSGASGQVPVAADNPLLADIAMGVPTVHLLPEASAPAADGNAPAPGVLLGNTASGEPVYDAPAATDPVYATNVPDGVPDIPETVPDATPVKEEAESSGGLLASVSEGMDWLLNDLKMGVPSIHLHADAGPPMKFTHPGITDHEAHMRMTEAADEEPADPAEAEREKKEAQRKAKEAEAEKAKAKAKKQKASAAKKDAPKKGEKKAPLTRAEKHEAAQARRKANAKRRAKRRGSGRRLLL